MLTFKEYLLEALSRRKASKLVDMGMKVGLAATTSWGANHSAMILHPLAQHYAFQATQKLTARPPVSDETYAANQKHTFDQASKRMKSISSPSSHTAIEKSTGQGFKSGRETSNFEDRRKEKPMNALGMYAHSAKTIYKYLKARRQSGDHTT
jgi:hypothetical protein